MGQKFDHRNGAFGIAAKKSSAASSDLGAMFKRLVNQAGQQLKGNFKGLGEGAFSSFKTEAEGIARDLNKSLTIVNGKQRGLNTTYEGAGSDMRDNAQKNKGAVSSVPAGRFRA
jgi:hypothetical protein